MCGLNLVIIIGWKINKVTNRELTFTKRSSNRVKCSRTTTKDEIARVLMCWARLLWSTPTISATMCRWALFGWNKIIPLAKSKSTSALPHWTWPWLGGLERTQPSSHPPTVGLILEVHTWYLSIWEHTTLLSTKKYLNSWQNSQI